MHNIKKEKRTILPLLHNSVGFSQSYSFVIKYNKMQYTILQCDR